MKILKRAAVLAAACSVALSFSGCNLLSTGDEMLRAPEAAGEVSEIKEALESLISGSYTLKYPTDGDYRSAIVRYDLTGDEREEAIAFYSTNQDNISQMHIAVLTEKDGKWQATKDVETLAAGVERIDFCDMNADGRKEILVGWNVVGNVDKQVSVYSFDDALLLPRAEEKYTEFLCCDLNTDQKNELLILQLNSGETASSARLLEFTEDGINEKSSVVTDNGVSAYFGVAVGKLLDGKTAVFVDGIKGSGSVTEIIYLAGDTLVNPLYNSETGATLTERPFTNGMFDVNADGSPDIPMQVVAPGFENFAESEREHITKWCSHSGKSLVVTLNTVSDFENGYYVEIPKALQEKITYLTSKDGRVKTFSLYDSEKKEKTDVLFKVKEFKKDEWKEEEGWLKAAETDSLVLAVQKTSYNGEYAQTPEQIAKCVKTFGAGEEK